MYIAVEPIGYVSSTRTAAVDDRWDEETSAIQLVPGFGPDSLLGLRDFSHIEVLYHFHKVDAASVVTGARHPRGNPAWPLTGIFAQRGKSRPNRLGVTQCRLLGIEGVRLHVSGLDAIDGTPVLEIKPWFGEFGPRGEVHQAVWASEMLKDYFAPSPDS